MAEKWCKDIVDDFSLVSEGKKTLNEFLHKYWEEFKPIYIHINGNCADEADLYLILHKFFNKLLSSDVQPVFNSDNQLFSYFKTTLRWHNYDEANKRQLDVVFFDDLSPNKEEDGGSYEDKLIDTSQLSVEEEVIGEIQADYLIQELSERLPDPCIQTLVLLCRGMTPNEIRKELGINYTTAIDRIWKIREAVEDITGKRRK